MKGFAVIALLPFALAFTVDKRQAGTPPPCAVGCIADVSLKPAPCSGTDFVCLCTNADIQKTVTECLTTSCSPDQIAGATAFFQTTCAQAGAPVEVPAASSAAAGPSSAVASATGAASSVAASASAAVSSLASSAAGAASSASGAMSSAMASASSAASSVRSSAVASASSSSGAQPTGVAKGFVAVGLGAVAGVMMM